MNIQERISVWLCAMLMLFVVQAPNGWAMEDKPAPKAGATGASGPTNNTSPFALTDQVSIDNQSIVVDGTTVTYDIRAGAITVSGKEPSSALGNIYFVSYFAKTPSDTSKRSRPIAFCFNGGPGSSSVWLHMGFLGPKTIDVDGLTHPPLPVGYKDNPQSLLASCDLVFIDPVSTGFSTATNVENAKCFHGVEEDLFSVADFIRFFLTKFQRWESPKLLIGESYGTLRAIGLAHILQDQYFIDIDGLVLVSLVLDTNVLPEVLCEYPSHDLPCITTLPTLAAIARYHNQLTGPLAQSSIPQVVESAKKFAIEEYAPALILGAQIAPEQSGRIAKRLAELTSLPEEIIKLQNLRISPDCFYSEFLKSKALRVGRFDGRATGYQVPNAPPICHEGMCYIDPSCYNVIGAFASSWQEYLARDLKWQKNEPYILLNTNIDPWKWTVGPRPVPGLGFLSFSQDFRMTMTNNPTLRVFVAAGYYDLATPYFSQQYSLSHLLLPPKLQKQITLKGYEGGHMMYLDKGSRDALHKDLVTFVNEVVTAK